MTRKNCVLGIFTTAVLLLSPDGTSAAKQSRDVLPASTKFSLSVANQQQFNDRLATTGLGKMLLDPALKPFLNDLPRQMRSEASGHPLGVLWIDLGVESGDIKDLSEGEVAWALVHSKGDKPSRVLMADVTNREKQVEVLLQKITASMGKQKARKTGTNAGATAVIVFNIPAAGNSAARKLVYFQKDDQLVFTEAVGVAQVLLENLGKDSAESLAKQGGYQQVIKQCKDSAGDVAPDAVLYLVPFEFSEALRELSPKQDNRADDSLAVARKHNFDAISAAGSFIKVGQGPFDFHLRIAVHAPQPWKNGMRICRFPNGQLAPAAWVGGDNSSYSMMNADFAALAKYVGPLFDDVYGEGEEGLYDDLKNTLLEDPDGPQIDIDKELYGRLSQQVSFVTRNQLPVTPDSPQKIIAIPTKDEKGLVEAVKKTLQGISEIEVRKVAGHEAYFGYEVDAETKEKPTFIACVAKDHLFLATDTAVLEHTLTAAKSQKPLSSNVDYQKLLTHWKQIDESASFRQFARLQDSLHVNYELFRQGKSPSSSKTYGGLLQNIVAGESPPVEKPKIDGSKLPAFDAVRQYFGLAGITGRTTSTGWFLHGFILKHDAE